eukprot:GAHX01002759.1.p1 GENE.GAHX01002759.1~~GAHX01002759.1.p1  ORF type:complete len:806 (+),score=133.58 GAHX01002759.1:35-2452(+)
MTQTKEFKPQQKSDTPNHVVTNANSLPLPAKKEMTNFLECIDGVYKFPEYKRQTINHIQGYMGPGCRNLLERKQYIDKTHVLARLFTGDIKILITRPRQFGKTALFDAIKFIAKGETSRPLFKGMHIYDQPWKNPDGKFVDEKGVVLDTPENSDSIDPKSREKIPEKAVPFPWKKYPVIPISFLCLSCDENDERLEVGLMRELAGVGKHYGVSERYDHHKLEPNEVCTYLSSLIRKLTCLGEPYEDKVVILIEEYDKILHGLFPLESQKKKVANDFLVKFYQQIKDMGAYIQLLVIIGTTPIRLNELSSPANVWDDAMIDDKYANLVGFTEKEIEETIDIRVFKKMYDQGKSYQRHDEPVLTDIGEMKKKVMSRLNEQYNGYKFSANGPIVYNPTSITKCFGGSRITNYWITRYSTRTEHMGMLLQCPTVLQKIYQKETVNFIPEYVLKAVVQTTMDKFHGAVASGFQLGYLTIVRQHTPKEIKLEIKRRIFNKLMEKLNDLEFDIIQLNDEKIRIENLQITNQERIYQIDRNIEKKTSLLNNLKEEITEIERQREDKMEETNETGLNFFNKFYSLRVPSTEAYLNIKNKIKNGIFISKSKTCRELERYIKYDSWHKFFDLLNRELLIPKYTHNNKSAYKKDLCAFIKTVLYMINIKPNPEEIRPVRKRSDIYFQIEDNIYLLNVKIHRSPYPEHQRNDQGFAQSYKYDVPKLSCEHKHIYVAGLNFLIHVPERTNQHQEENNNTQINREYSYEVTVNNAYIKLFGLKRKKINGWNIELDSYGESMVRNYDPYPRSLDERLIYMT